MLGIVPVKALQSAKERLAPALSGQERRNFVMWMLDQVLAACAASAAIDETLIVTPDPGVVPGDMILLDAGVGHAQAIAAALGDPRARNGALVVMADCPLVRSESLDRLAEAARPVALAPAADGGMNALALREPARLEPAFGLPDAARLTAERARAVGIEAVVVEDPLLALDVDRPSDLGRLRALVAA